MSIAKLENYKLFNTFRPAGTLIDVPTSKLTLLTSASYSAAGNNILGDGHDQAIANVSIGFVFNFDDSNYSRMFISTNGILIPTNSSDRDVGLSYVGFGPVTTVRNFPQISPYWSDQRTAPFSSSIGGLGGIHYGTANYGFDGHQVFIVRFENQRASYASPKSMMTYEAVFHSNTNIIEFNYKGFTTIHAGGVSDLAGVPVITAPGTNANTGYARLRHCLANTHPLGGSDTTWTLTTFAAQYPGGEGAETKMTKQFIFSPPKQEK